MRERVPGGWTHWICVIALIALYLTPRLTRLDTFVTWDERQWLAQSANFYSALVHLDLARTFQTAHPGVTTMWIGTLAYLLTLPAIGTEFSTNAVSAWIPGADHQEIHERVYELGGTPREMLVAARIVKIIVQGLMVGFALLILRRHLGNCVTFVAGGLISLSPFIIAHDRVFAIDGLLMSTTLMAVAALAHAFVSGPYTLAPWVLSGAAAALTWLTRLNSVAIVGVLALLVLWSIVLETRGCGSPWSRVRRWMQPISAWLATAGATTLVLWPAWVASPIGTAKNVINNLLSIGAFEGRYTLHYFLGTTTHDPGPVYYPIVLAWRSTPVEWVGLLALVFLAVGGAMSRRADTATRRVTGVLVAYLATYLVGMTMGASKSDRYMAVVISLLCVLSAVGLVGSLHWLSSRLPSVRRASIMPIGIALAIATQGVFASSSQPYYLTYYNPALGGINRAVSEIEVGWGEGGGEAADYLDEHMRREGVAPDDMMVRGPYNAPWLVTYLLDEQVRWTSDLLDTLAEWQGTDYLLVYIADWQRQPNDAVDAYAMEFPPDYTVVLDGVDYIWIYDLRELPVPDFLRSEAGTSAGRNLARIGNWVSQSSSPMRVAP